MSALSKRLLNASGILIWLILSIVVLERTLTIEPITSNVLAYLGLTVPATIYGITVLVAGLIIIDLVTPWFDFSELFQGDGLSKLSGALVFGSLRRLTDKPQILTYLKLAECRLGMLINYNVVLIKDGIRRVVNKL